MSYAEGALEGETGGETQPLSSQRQEEGKVRLYGEKETDSGQFIRIDLRQTDFRATGPVQRG